MNLFGRHRCASLVGGPLDGDDHRVPLPANVPWPTHSCHLVAGVWERYAHDGDGRYRHIGRCVEVDCLHGQPGCDRETAQ